MSLKKGGNRLKKINIRLVKKFVRMLDKCIVCLSNDKFVHEDEESLVDMAVIKDTLLNSVLSLSFKKHEKQSELCICSNCYMEVRNFYTIIEQLDKIKNEFETLKERILEKCISSVVKASNVKVQSTSLQEVTSAYPKDSLPFKIYKKWRGRCKKEFLKQVLNVEKPKTQAINETSNCLRMMTYDHCYSSASQSQLDGNKYLARIKTTPYVCSQCDISFHRQARLRQHILICHSQQAVEDDDSKSKIFTCPVPNCGSEFRKATQLKQHLTKFHTQDQFDKCQDCHKFFRVSKDNDLQSSHSCSFSRKCKQCGELYFSRKAYQTHVQEKQCKKVKVVVATCREKVKSEFKCHYCPRSFTTKQGLFYHLATHTGEKSFGCDICRKAFVNQTQLQIHKRIHSGEKNYVCQSCGIRVSSLAGLSSHLKTHAAVKPYKCNICEKTFRSAGHLSKHNLIHTGQRPHACPICQRAFNRKENLRAHELSTHRNVKPHVCHICPGTSFTRAGLLRKHLKHKHSPAQLILNQSTPTLLAHDQSKVSTDRIALPILFENKQQQQQQHTIVCVDHLQNEVNILCDLPSSTHPLPPPLDSVKTSGQDNELTLNETSIIQETLFFANTDGQYLILKE